MKVELINFTDQAKELLVLGKRTRHMKDSAAWAEVLGMAEESLDEELGYVFSTISGPLEFVNYTFLITGVTRAFTHQLVRHRVGVSFAQQSQRFAEQEGFNYLTTGSINRDDRLGEIYDNTMDGIQSGYSELLAEGANQQDARGVLPTNILTNILMKMNLRSLSSLMEVRLCVRSQGEFQDVSRAIKSLVLDVHPWAECVLQPYCIKNYICYFPRFDNCPVKSKFGFLNGPSEDDRNSLKMYADSIGSVSKQPR